MFSINNLVKLTENLSILFVEDNVDTRESLTRVFENMFEHIICAVDGKDGLDKFKVNDIDVVITDINMPNMNGLDMIRYIKKINHQVPIFIFSAHHEPEFFVKAIDLGVEGYMLKPINHLQFMQTLFRTLQRISLKKENEEFRETLEQKVQTQLKQLRDKDNLILRQSRLAQMGEMISMIAHQWRQPLNAIGLTSSNLKFKCIMGNMNKDEFYEELDLIESYSQHLSETIDDFRGFFKDKKVKDVVSLEEMINQTLKIVEESLKNKNIKIIKDFNCHKKISTYQNEVNQVILNLIKNAEDALIDKKIKNAMITIKTLCDVDNNCQLIIQDNAGGISKGIIDNIFDPYFSTKKEKDGTGLGLYMSKTIIEEHCYGNLSVNNDANGAIFKIKF